MDFWIQIFINNVKDIDTTSSMQDTNKNIWKECQICLERIQALLRIDHLKKRQCINLHKKIDCIIKVFSQLIIYNNDRM